jgi:glycosyltransferase involved in cell wall biosynthesis
VPGEVNAVEMKLSSLSVVLPAHNEEGCVEGVVRNVSSVLARMGIDHEILLVDDGSTDRTGELGRRLESEIPGMRLVQHFPSRGYGGALKAGFAEASRDWIVFYPGDGQFVFEEIDRLIAKTGRAEIVSGYRADRKDILIRRLNAMAWKALVMLLFGRLCRDIDCGFKLFRRQILSHVVLEGDGATLDTELLAGAKAAGYRIDEVEVTHLPRTTGKATGADLQVILRALRDLPTFRLRLHRDRSRQKVSRLAAEIASEEV